MKLHTISINNLKRRKAKMAFLTVGLMVGISTIVTLVTLTSSMYTRMNFQIFMLASR